MRMQEESGRKIEKELIDDVLGKKFRWAKPRSDFFLQRNRIGTLRELMEQEGSLPVWESAVLREIRTFMEFCLEEREK